MSLSITNFEIFLLILVRITGFIYTAPFFSIKDVPGRVKTGLSICITIIVFFTLGDITVGYNGVMGYSFLVVKEALVGVIMGMFSNIAYHIISFSGNLIDMEIGFSMVNELDPVTKIQTTITSNLYGYLVMLIMIVSDLHHYFLKALVDSFQVIGVGTAVINPNIYQLMLRFITDYFIIGFRIVLPIFASILVVNTLLAILSKVAPQLNMFVIGMQLKVFVGLVTLVLIIELIPSVADFIFNEMITMLKAVIKLMV